ncbi:Glutamyl-tRNA amidotransferase subunit A [Yamadazyma tenuis]|uniref:Glutamyl-tRNA amidotransferase subunit A n=1 Tax=Candida tenuis (strain ATCC 10573 / BCRC 21748 / CBS 615 / JCM 9827 / NBRC 10315 / NRRL Y-1498 / VKM Y-70) TaxID=590646 RepID=G3B882_CANTC|nr:Glutamyl-tRNA amidotransferase subunit A [Yamadazyma tenuis ATCC 10573]EGV61708.1 Glutamyl-tRNA amidotransferase subunit A [Yamadazyma tenuis ATCC 10573]WEJ92942.1 Glutamyl-tRNA amidotransferase subunit A [Yamadazyma tenuis]
MSITSLEADPNCKVTLEDLHAQPAKLGLQLRSDEVEDYYKILCALDRSAKKLVAMEDYYQPTFLDRFPRKDIHYPEKADNLKGAWAYKVTIEDTKPQLSKNRPLAGKTICIKDCVEIAGVPQIFGTDAFKPWVPKADATVVTRLLEAGGIIKGLATCENQSSSTSSNTASTGNVENPYHDGYSAGGSSSGTGYLVGSGEIDIGVGADQGGSIRVPSAHCGLVGFKPTFGLVPYTGIGSLETNIDHCGPMTRTVLENCTMLEVMAGQDGFDDRQNGSPTIEHVPKYKEITEKSSLKGMKIGILKESLEVPTMTPAMKAKFLEAAEKFKALGAEVVEISIPYHLVAPEIWMIGQRISGCVRKLGLQTGRRILKSTEYASHILPWTQESFDKTPVPVKNGIVNGLYLSEHYPSLYVKSINLSFKARDEYNKALEQVDVLITPTVPVVAPPHGIRDGTPLELIKNTIGLNANTGIFNMTGHPALTLPVGFLAAIDNPDIKLPVGLQIIGKHFDELSIYRAAYGWESANDWKAC